MMIVKKVDASAPINDPPVLDDVSTVNDTAHDKYNVGDIDICNACTATELTGLMARPPMNDYETESYHDIFSFGPPDITHFTAK